MLIRNISWDDINTTWDIYAQAFDHSSETLKFYKWESFIKFCMTAGYAFILDDDDRSRAFIIGYERPDMFNGKAAHIELLAVHPSVQKRGYAKFLIDYFTKAAQSNGIKEVTISTACYKDAYLIYRHLGFTDSQGELRTLYKRV